MSLPAPTDSPRLFVIVLAVISLCGAPGPVNAQDPGACSGDARLGFSTAVGELTDVASTGPALGLGFGCPVTERLSFRATSDAVLRIGPHMHMLYLLAGPRLRLTSPDARRWRVTARIEGGWTGVATFGGCAGTCPRWARMESSVTAGGGIRVRRHLGDAVGVVLDAGLRFLFVNSDDVTTFDGRLIEGFDTATVIPVSAGLEVRF